MAHKTLIGATAYEIGGGKTLIGGTSYSIDKGKTLVDGTAYDVGFVPDMVTVTITMASDFEGSIVIDGQYIYSGVLTVPIGTEVTFTVYSNDNWDGGGVFLWQTGKGYVPIYEGPTQGMGTYVYTIMTDVIIDAYYEETSMDGYDSVDIKET